MLLFLLFGLFSLRFEQRTLLLLLLNAPPRNTRATLVSLPPQHQFQEETGGCQMLFDIFYSIYAIRPKFRLFYFFPPLVTFCQPPSSRPISATILATCWYWPSDSQPQRAARRR